MDILDFFSKWEYDLVNSPPRDSTNWQRHFISQASWFDLRMCILGFVSLCRYVFPGGAAGSDVDQRQGASRSHRRYVNPRTFSQVRFARRCVWLAIYLTTPRMSYIKWVFHETSHDMSRGMSHGICCTVGRDVPWGVP